jgi:hypothetical protein
LSMADAKKQAKKMTGSHLFIDRRQSKFTKNT